MALVALRIEGIIISSKQRRRIKTEEKAKVVAAVCGTEKYSISCRASFFALGRFEEDNSLHQDDLKKMRKSSYS